MTNAGSVRGMGLTVVCWVKDDNVPFFDKGRGCQSRYQNVSYLRLPVDTPLHEQPREPDGDALTECTKLFEPKEEGEWCSSTHMAWQLHNLAIPLFEASSGGVSF